MNQISFALPSLIVNEKEEREKKEKVNSQKNMMEILRYIVDIK